MRVNFMASTGGRFRCIIIIIDCCADLKRVWCTKKGTVATVNYKRKTNLYNYTIFTIHKTIYVTGFWKNDPNRTLEVPR